MLAEIEHGKAKELFWQKKWLQTNKQIEIGLGDALRISRQYKVKYNYKKYLYEEGLFKKKIFGFTGDADKSSGFGNCTVNLIKNSLKDGYDVRWVGRINGVPEFSNLASKEIPEGIGMVWHEQPKEEWFYSPFSRNISILPFETTNIPASWVPKLNTFDAILVPCHHNVEMMKNSGVKVPIKEIRWGIDPKLFYPLQRNNDVFTFGTIGSLSIRKGTDLLIEAFQKAFPKNRKEPVKLICKSSSNIFTFGGKDDSRIEIKLLATDHQSLLNIYKKIDCFILPTRGEGGPPMPLIETMATGIPAIITNWSGPVDYMTEKEGWFVDYELRHSDAFERLYKEDCGDWANPKLDDLIEKMRYTYEHQDEVKRKGENARKFIQENFTWEKVMPLFYSAISEVF